MRTPVLPCPCSAGGGHQDLETNIKAKAIRLTSLTRDLLLTNLLLARSTFSDVDTDADAGADADIDDDVDADVDADIDADVDVDVDADVGVDVDIVLTRSIFNEPISSALCVLIHVRMVRLLMAASSNASMRA